MKRRRIPDQHRDAVLALRAALVEPRELAATDPIATDTVKRVGQHPQLPPKDRFVPKHRVAWAVLYVLEDVLTAPEWDHIDDIIDTFRVAAQHREDRARRAKVHRLRLESP